MPRLESLKALWVNHRLKLAMSIFCIAVALFDTFFQTLSLIAAGALSIAVLPWVMGLIERVTAPGGFEIVFADAKRKLDQTETRPDAEDAQVFEYFKTDDPNLAVALLRVEIERRLRRIAEQVFSDSVKPRRGLKPLMEELREQGAISNDAAALILDLLPVMNQAVHGIHLRPDVTEFAIRYGPRILARISHQRNTELKFQAPTESNSARTV